MNPFSKHDVERAAWRAARDAESKPATQGERIIAGIILLISIILIYQVAVKINPQMPMKAPED